MKKILIGINEGNQNQIFKLMKYEKGRDGSDYYFPIPKLLSPTGLHMSLHSSGECHYRSEKPRETEHLELPKIENIQPSQLESFFNKIIRLPKKGSPALIGIIDSGKARQSICPVLTNRIIVNLANLYHYLTILWIEDTEFLPVILEDLTTSGMIKHGDWVFIQTIETEQSCIYQPSNAIPKATTGPAKIMSKVKGDIITIQHDEIERSLMESPIFKPMIDPLNEIMKKLEGHVNQTDDFYFPDFAKYMPEKIKVIHPT